MMLASATADPRSGRSPTRAIADFAAALRAADLPVDVRALVGDLLLDYLRVASIGSEMAWSRWARDYVARLGMRGQAFVLFSEASDDPVRAAFLNATYAGSIDADDTHVGAMLHPGAIVFSAALAASSEVDASGADFVAAVVAGYESMIRIGLSIQPTHFRRGFQSTATCGGFGAAVAAARLLFGDSSDAATRIADTIGLVASTAGGLTQFYRSGSSVKRIHASRAAESGVAAALLARSGFGGPTDILEGENGFARAYADDFEPERICSGLGESFRIREVTVKGHACSARVQAAIEGIVALCREHAVEPDMVEDVRIGIPAVIQDRLTLPGPVDVQAAQMSLPYSAALALAAGSAAGDGFALTVRDFERGLHDRRIAALEARIRCEIDPKVEAATTTEAVPALIDIRLRSGDTLSAFVAAPMGSPSRPYRRDDHIDRFRNELRSRWPSERCEAVAGLAADLAAVGKIRNLTGLLS